MGTCTSAFAVLTRVPPLASPISRVRPLASPNHLHLSCIMSRLLVILIVACFAVSALARPWIPGGDAELEGVALETGIGKNVDAPLTAHADNPRIFYLHGFPMDCGPGMVFNGSGCGAA